MEFHTTSEYREWLAEVKTRIAASRVRAALSANSELIRLYYELGARIVEREENAQWGSGFIDGFSRDLKKAFPDLKGFSVQNLRYCRAFYRFYSSGEIRQQSVGELGKDPDRKQAVAKMDGIPLSAIVQQPVGQVPWGHNIQIFTKAADLKEAAFYINETIRNGWSRDVLAQQIKSDLYRRSGQAVSNFKQTLPAVRSELARQTLKDPYVFDFFSLTVPYNERDIERQLVKHDKVSVGTGQGIRLCGATAHH